MLSASKFSSQWTRFNEGFSGASLTFPTSDEGDQCQISRPFLSSLTFFHCLNDEADMSKNWRILEVQIHALWRQNCVRWVQQMVEELVKVPSWDGDLQNTSNEIRGILRCILLIDLNPPSTYVGICLQGDRLSLLKPFGVRTLWAGAVHLWRGLWSHRNRKEDLLRSSRRIVVCASWWIWWSQCRLHRAGLKLEWTHTHSAHFGWGHD